MNVKITESEILKIKDEFIDLVNVFISIIKENKLIDVENELNTEMYIFKTRFINKEILDLLNKNGKEITEPVIDLISRKQELILERINDQLDLITDYTVNLRESNIISEDVLYSIQEQVSEIEEMLDDLEQMSNTFWNEKIDELGKYVKVIRLDTVTTPIIND